MSDFLERAVEAHVAWKTKLRVAINGGTSPDATISSRDDQCELGKWIYGEGAQKYGAAAELKQLRDDHKKFHTCVGSILTSVKNGEIDKAKHELDKGPYSSLSTSVVLALRNLSKKAA